MRKVLSLLLCLVMILPVGGLTFAGNNIPGDEYYGHFNLNIIGVKYEKDMDDAYGGSVIFVLLENQTVKIMIEKKEEFPLIVTDKNGTDDSASFILPKPGTRVMLQDIDGEYTIETNDFISDYAVFARPLGSPQPLDSTHPRATLLAGQLETFAATEGIWEYIYTEYPDFEIPEGYDTSDYTFVVDQDSIQQNLTEILFTRKKGQSKFQDISTEVLTVNFTVSFLVFGPGLSEDGFLMTLTLSLNLFDEMLESVFWEYQNDRLKLLQIRFYYNAGPKNKGKKK